MASSNKRERDLARAKAQRQEARRTAQRQRRARASAVTAAVVVLAVVAGVAGVSALTGEQEQSLATDSPDETSSEASPSAAAAGDCTYREEGEASRPVEPPPTGDAVVRDGAATIRMTTGRGDVVVTADAASAPCTVNALASLAEQDFYAGTTCHRLTTEGIFVLQCGDPQGDGLGGPGYRYDEENLPQDFAPAPGSAASVVYPAGTMAMAKSSVPGSTGSQFFLVYADSPLTPDYTVVGQITSGLDLVQQVADAGVEGGGGDGPPADPLELQDVAVTFG